MSKFIWDTPIQIGNILVKNRIVFPPIASNWANSDGSISNKILKFYEDISSGGGGMVVIEGTAISPEGKGISNSLCIYNEIHLSGLKSLSKIIQKNNCFDSIQLNHAGGQANPNFTGFEPISPSGLECKATGFASRKLTIKEIIDIRDKFINSAIMADKSGFRAVELHLAHGYLLHEFLSKYANKRQDIYGGNIENRIRLHLEIISGIKEQAPALIVGVRVSGEDYLNEGINEKTNKKILPLFENAGIDYFSVSAGTYETSKLKHEAMARGEFFSYSRGIKKIVDKPVIGVGKVLDLKTAERHLKNNDCDLVAIGRGQIADSNMVNKTRNNQPINRCRECNQCSYLRFGRKDLCCPIREKE